MRAILFRAAYNLPVTAGVARGVFERHGLELDIVYTRGSQMTSASSPLIVVLTTTRADLCWAGCVATMSLYS